MGASSDYLTNIRPEGVLTEFTNQFKNSEFWELNYFGGKWRFVGGKGKFIHPLVGLGMVNLEARRDISLGHQGQTSKQGAHHTVSTTACNGCRGTKKKKKKKSPHLPTAAHYLFYKYFLNYQRFLISTFYAWLQWVRRGSRKREAEKEKGGKEERGESSEEEKENNFKKNKQTKKKQRLSELPDPWIRAPVRAVDA